MGIMLELIVRSVFKSDLASEGKSVQQMAQHSDFKPLSKDDSAEWDILLSRDHFLRKSCKPNEPSSDVE